MYKVLIVDDERIVRENIRDNINWISYGFYPVAEAENGLQALELVNELKPELVVTDIRMPDMDGIELLKRVKALDTRIQVLMISAYNDFTYAQDALYHSALGYLLKPVDKQELDRIMKKALKLIEPSQSIDAGEREMSITERARVFILENYMRHISLEEIAKQKPVSTSYLSRVFKNETGSSVLDYLTSVRMRHACEMLIESKTSIADIALSIGYDDYTYFCKVFKKECGCTPLKYRMNSKR